MKLLNIDGFPNAELLNKVLNLHDSIFKDAATLISKAENKSKVVFNLALEDEEIIGYKIGYELEPNLFYSWLGGVDESHRNKGVASKLMDQQHLYLIEKGYEIVQTKTKNKWRGMLVLIIKSGFDVIGTYTDNEGEPKIILEKRL
ncbi:GNAT family N-acetyltransferase [Virgibacillus halodenitrificans]|uniref:GNAT family N-acetyltransferase n=1 Tax=Virgibacillus halodenitrificans TaxID=1482 RepID=A0AAC9NKB5_VIRHA|nr:GNAT family N-acetyltransferase [Virgibacillus halodenitrificans]APC47680.1 GNAT family N-acetyltransferase [Virgibacillus halodenitrificans]MCJ0930530.1 GNAT family N-acetyltransferase [Virgibacillus halodenitrificans]